MDTLKQYKEQWKVKDQRNSHHSDSYAKDQATTTSEPTCSRCGAPVDPSMKFCEECGNQLFGTYCPYCHNELNAGDALCSHCGKPVNPACCSFCGCAMDEDEMFCSECGNPRRGISCPECGTLNFRSFCKVCNTPLNGMAHEMLAKVKADPRIHKMKTVAQELEVIEQKLNALMQSQGLEPQEQPDNGISEADQKILEEYRALFKDVTILKPEAAPKKIQPQSNTARPARFTLPEVKSLLEEYNKKKDEMQSVMDSMLPDPADPPEIQRNFMSACMVATFEQKKEIKRAPSIWVCNFCGAHHQCPSQCAKPELGGRWIYNEVEVIRTIKKSDTIYV